MNATHTRTADTGTEWRQQLHTARARARAIARVDDVQLQPVGADQWRVMNAALTPDDVDALLGFVERVDSFYDVTFLTEPSMVHRFLDRDEARRAFVADSGTSTVSSSVVVDAGPHGPAAAPQWLRRDGIS